MADDEEPTNTEELVQRAVERANQIQALMNGAEMPYTPITVVAMVLMAATGSVQIGLSMNDAFSIYLAMHEQVEVAESQQVAQTVARLKNSLTDRLRDVLGIPPKEERTH